MDSREKTRHEEGRRKLARLFAGAHFRAPESPKLESNHQYKPVLILIFGFSLSGMVAISKCWTTGTNLNIAFCCFPSTNLGTGTSSRGSTRARCGHCTRARTQIWTTFCHFPLYSLSHKLLKHQLQTCRRFLGSQEFFLVVCELARFRAMGYLNNVPRCPGRGENRVHGVSAMEPKGPLARLHEILISHVLCPCRCSPARHNISKLPTNRREIAAEFDGS